MEIDNCEKLACSLYEKRNYVVHITALKQALDHALKLENSHEVIEFSRKTWSKTYIDINKEFIIQGKNDFVKDCFKLMDNSMFTKTMENVPKHRDIELVTNNRKSKSYVAEPNYHTTKWFQEKLLAIELNKTKVKINESAYLSLLISYMNKIVMYEYWYDYRKPKYGNNVKLCYTDTCSFIVHVKSGDIYAHLAGDVDKRLDT